jgi:hypothetical protein
MHSVYSGYIQYHSPRINRFLLVTVINKEQSFGSLQHFFTVPACLFCNKNRTNTKTQYRKDTYSVFMPILLAPSTMQGCRILPVMPAGVIYALLAHLHTCQSEPPGGEGSLRRGRVTPRKNNRFPIAP